MRSRGFCVSEFGRLFCDGRRRFNISRARRFCNNMAFEERIWRPKSGQERSSSGPRLTKSDPPRATQSGPRATQERHLDDFGNRHRLKEIPSDLRGRRTKVFCSPSLSPHHERTPKRGNKTDQIRPGAAQERPRAPQERLKSGQELHVCVVFRWSETHFVTVTLRPRAAQDPPKRHPERSKSDPWWPTGVA